MVTLEAQLFDEIIKEMEKFKCLKIADRIRIYSIDGTEHQKKRIADLAVILKDLRINGNLTSRLIGALNQLENRFNELSDNEIGVRVHNWLDGFISALVITEHPNQTSLEIFFRKLMEVLVPAKQGWEFGKGIYK